MLNHWLWAVRRGLIHRVFQFPSFEYQLVAQSCPTLVTPWLQLTRLLCLWDFPGKNTEVGYHFLLQGIFPTQGSNLHLLSLTLRDRLFTTAPPGKPLIYTACCAVLSHVRLFAPPWTVARQALLSMGILQARVVNLRGPTIQYRELYSVVYDNLYWK